MKELLSDIVYPLLFSIIMCAIVFLFQDISNFYIALIVQLLVGVVVYLAINVISKNRNYRLFEGLVKDALRKE